MIHVSSFISDSIVLYHGFEYVDLSPFWLNPTNISFFILLSMKFCFVLGHNHLRSGLTPCSVLGVTPRGTSEPYRMLGMELGVAVSKQEPY